MLLVVTLLAYVHACLPCCLACLSQAFVLVFLPVQVVINDRVVKSLSLVNSGRVNYDFVWDLGKEPNLSVKPQGGTVPRGERRVVELVYAPTTAARLTDYPISCQVRITASETFSTPLDCWAAGFSPGPPASGRLCSIHIPPLAAP